MADSIKLPLNNELTKGPAIETPFKGPRPTAEFLWFSCPILLLLYSQSGMETTGVLMWH